VVGTVSRRALQIVPFADWAGGRHPAYLLPQTGQFGSQAGELVAELSVLLLLGQNEPTAGNRCREPVRF
jgi:hypothetical protein